MSVMLPDGTTAPEALVRRATGAVSYAMRSALYRLSADGFPSEPSLRTAVQDAIQEQVLALRLTGEEEAARASSAALSPLGVPLSQASLGGAVWTAEKTSSVPSSHQIPAAGGLCLAAWEILRNAGLLGGYIYG